MKPSNNLHGSGNGSHFVAPARYYVLTFLGLVFLTIVTVFTAKYLDLGRNLNITLALVIAALKASLVILFFMGLRWDKGFNAVFFLGTLFFLLVFLVLTLMDYTSRDDLYPDRNNTYDLRSPVQTNDAKGKKGH